MSMEQETLIYVEENDRAEARVLAQSFVHNKTKSRAYINALGAELGMKYLALESINSSKTYNIHSVHKILEEFDISDIMLANMHIDVRVVFDENYIFIPKSHFRYEILPDIYLVLHLAQDHSHASFLGFFEPKLINKNNQNSEYYFIEKEKLTSPSNLKAFVESFKGNTTQSLSNAENEKAELLMISMADQNISEEETKELLKYLKKSADLRDKFIEFENFEILAYKAEHCPDIKIPSDSEGEEVLNEVFDGLGADVSEQEEDTQDEGFASDLFDNNDSETSEELLEDESLTVDSFEGLDVSGNADFSELADGITDIAAAGAAGIAGAAMAEGAAAAEGIIDAVENVGGILESAEELLMSSPESNGIELKLDTVDTEIPEMSAQVSDTVEDSPLQSADGLLEGLSEIPLLEEVDIDEEVLSGASNELDGAQSVEAGEISMLDSVAADETPDDISVIDKTSVDVSAVDTSEMADIDALTAAASAGNFEEVSLDDLTSDEEEDNSSDLNSLEALQEENARKKGLLPAIDDDSLLENSLDFSNVEIKPNKDAELANVSEVTMDISGFDAIAPEVCLEEAPEADENGGVLDISNVNAVPNNFGDNMSETVELNHFESVDSVCENQTNVQKTEATTDFGTFEPLDDSDLFIDGSVDFDNIAVASPQPQENNAAKKPASPQDVDLSGFQSLDMEEFSFVPMEERMVDNSIPKEKEEEDLATALLGGLDLDSLDDIPSLDGADIPAMELSEGFEEDAQASDHVEGSLAERPAGEPEMLSFDSEADASLMAADESVEIEGIESLEEDTVIEPEVEEPAEAFESVEDLSVDDIIDSPEESSVDVNLISEAVDLDVAQDELSEGALDGGVFESSYSETEAEPVFDNVGFETPSQSETEYEDAAVARSVAVQTEPIAQESQEDDISSIGTPLTDDDNADLSMLFAGNDMQDGVSEAPTEAYSQLVDENESFVPTLPHLPQRQSGGGMKIVGAAILLALLVSGTIFGLNIKNKNKLVDSEALSQPVPENTELPAPPVQEENNNIMANAPEVIDMPQNQAEPTNVNPQQASDTSKASASKPVNPEGAVMSVKKLSWELPDYLSYSQEMKKYLQTAGKSIKLTLTSDLLLATEYAYSNQVKLSLKLSNEGAIQDSKIVVSSGSDEIDKIVLQTVKETLNVVKPAQGEVPTPDFNLGLIINF